jgi:hypothetical protein
VRWCERSASPTREQDPGTKWKLREKTEPQKDADLDGLPEWQRLQLQILDVLEEYPEAREKIAQAMREHPSSAPREFE